MGLLALARLKGELETLFGTTVDILRMRKQLDGTMIQKSILQDSIYV